MNNSNDMDNNSNHCLPAVSQIKVSSCRLTLPVDQVVYHPTADVVTFSTSFTKAQMGTTSCNPTRSNATADNAMQHNVYICVHLPPVCMNVYVCMDIYMCSYIVCHTLQFNKHMRRFMQHTFPQGSACSEPVITLSANPVAAPCNPSSM